MNKDYINSWLDLAIKDIEISKVLFENRYYSNSFYHFQQASEKGIKAYAFMNKIFTTEKDVFQTSHYTLKIFKDSIFEQRENIQTLKQFEFDTLFGKAEFENYSKKIQSEGILPDKKDVIEYPAKMLDEILNLFEELKKFEFKFPLNFESLYLEKMDEFIDLIRKLNPDEAENMKSEFDRLKENKEELSEMLKNIEYHYLNALKQMPDPLILFFSNLISHNHNNLSRYPSLDFNPLKYYNLKRPIVKKLPELTNYLYSTLLQLRRINI